MNRFFSTLCISVLALGTIAGCSRTKPLTPVPDESGASFPDHTLNMITGLIQTGAGQLSTMQAETSMSVRTPARSGSFQTSIMHRRSDSLLATISPGLGIEAVRALVTADSFYVHNRIDKDLTYGALNSLSRLVPFEVTSDTLYPSLLGLIGPAYQSSNWTLENTSTHYIIRSQDNRRIFTIDPTYWRVVRYEERNGAGELLEERTFSEFWDKEGILLPRRITVRRPKDDTAISIYYRKLTLNEDLPAFAFSVNPGVPRRLVN